MIMIMIMKELNCDMAHVLESRDFSVLEKLISHCSNIRAKIAAQAEDATAYQIECLGKKKQRHSNILELQKESESLKSEIDATKLQQTVVSKKLLNAAKQKEKLNEDLKEMKLKRECLSLEMIDLQQASETRKQHKISTWNAIKLACHTYKQYLDIRIQLLDSKEHEEVQIFFFICDPATKDNYFAHLINVNNQWRVKLIEPRLEEKHFGEFKGIVDFSKESEISDITAFLCKLRHIFVKYYLNTK